MTGKIRIIGGQWRGRKLVVPERAGLRPTGDRVRETLFNWLQPHIIGARCLDLFAGTGALGLEAASRGAGSVVMIEHDRELAGRLRQVADEWPGGERIEVIHTNAFRWLDNAGDPFGIVFVDPPFGQGLQLKAIDALVERGLLSTDALVYVEQAIDEEADQKVIEDRRFEVVRDKPIGRVRARLLKFVPSGPV